MQKLSELFSLPIFQNSLADWSIAAGVTVVVFSALWIVRRIVRTYHARLQATDRVEIMEIPLEVLSRTSLLFMIVVSLFAGLNSLAKSPQTIKILDVAITIVLFWQVRSLGGRSDSRVG